MGEDMTPLEAFRKWVSDQIAAGKTSDIVGDPNCMIQSVPSATVCNGRAATLVHPQIVQFSMHHPIFIGWPMDFGGETYTVVKEAWNPLPYWAPNPDPNSGPDIAFAMLDRPVTNVNPMRVLLAAGSDLHKLPAFFYVPRSNRIQLLEVTNFNVLFSNYVRRAVTLGLPTDASWRVGTNLISGDSSSPLFAMIDGEPVLLGTAQSTRACSAIQTYHDFAYGYWRNVFGINDKYQTISLKLGDTNDDNVVDFADFIKLANNFGKKTDKGHNDGDFDRDGDVDMADYVTLSNNYGT